MMSNESEIRALISLLSERIDFVSKRLDVLNERVDSLVSFISESLTAVDVRLAKIEKDFNQGEQATTD